MTARWENPRKIVARCGLAKGGQLGQNGEVIVVTASGGRGTSTVQFRVYTVQIGPLQESAVWVDESRTLPVRSMGPSGGSPTIDDDVLGIADEREE